MGSREADIGLVALQWLVDRVKYALENRIGTILSVEARKVLTTVEGIYRDGRIELKNLPSNVAEEAKVIVTFVDNDVVELAAHGSIDLKQKFYGIH